jgi:hypothetical protein
MAKQEPIRLRGTNHKRVITWPRFGQLHNYFARTSAGLIVSIRGKLGLTQAESRDRPIVAEAEGAGRHHGFPFKGRVFSTVIGWRIGFGCALRGRGLARALHHGALCGLGIVLLQGLAGSCEVALMVLREDRVKAAKAASLNRTRSPNKRRPAKARCQTPAG